MDDLSKMVDEAFAELSNGGSVTEEMLKALHPSTNKEKYTPTSIFATLAREGEITPHYSVCNCGQHLIVAFQVSMIRMVGNELVISIEPIEE